jgi:hypothetical protein
VAAPLASSHGLALAGAPKCEGRRGDILIVGIAHVPAYDPTGGYSLMRDPAVDRNHPAF